MSNKKLVTIILLACGGLGLAGIAACAGVVYFAYRTTDASISPVIDELFMAIEQDKFAETYDTHTTTDLRKVATREQYAALGQMVKVRLGALQSKSLGRFNFRQFNADRFAEVTYNATFEKGSGVILARLKKSGDGWLLINFQVNSPEFQKDVVTRNCPHCGEPHTATAKFCPKCGKQLVGDQPAEKAPAESQN